MTLRDVIDDVCLKWWGQPLSGLANAMESAILAWEAERDCRMDQIIALVKADLNPCLRKSTGSIIQGADADSHWNLQLSPEAGRLIDFDGATLEDVLKEACAKYLFAKEATT